MKQIMQKLTPKNKQTVIQMAVMGAIMCLLLVSTMTPIYAAAEDVVMTATEKVITVIERIFQVMGGILLVYSIGQLILAFKNEDGDSKSRASAMLVVSAFLIGLPVLVDELDIPNLISS